MTISDEPACKTAVRQNCHSIPDDTWKKVKAMMRFQCDIDGWEIADPREAAETFLAIIRSREVDALSFDVTMPDGRTYEVLDAKVPE